MARNAHHSGPGPSQRQLRVGELVRRTLSDVLARGEIHPERLASWRSLLAETG